MATFVLVHGAASDSWQWHGVTPRLRKAGHEPIAVDLPCEDESAGLERYAEVIASAIGKRREVVLVAQSLAGFSAPLASVRARVELIVLVNAMVPKPGESANDWWANTGQPKAMLELAAREGRTGARAEELMNDPAYLFLHDLPPEMAAELGRRVRRQAGAPFAEPWPLPKWPEVPTRVLASRHDRLFPLEFQRRVALERLGLSTDEIDGGHLVTLSHPDALAARLDRYWTELRA